MSETSPVVPAEQDAPNPDRALPLRNKLVAPSSSWWTAKSKERWDKADVRRIAEYNSVPRTQAAGRRRCAGGQSGVGGGFSFCELLIDAIKRHPDNHNFIIWGSPEWAAAMTTRLRNSSICD